MRHRRGAAHTRNMSLFLVLFPWARNAARPLHHQHLPDPYIISTSPATIPAALSPISHFPLAVLLGSQAGQIASAHHPAPAYGESYASRLGFGPSPRASLRSIPARVSRASCRAPAHLPPPLPPPSSAPPFPGVPMRHGRGAAHARHVVIILFPGAHNAAGRPLHQHLPRYLPRRLYIYMLTLAHP